jgi:dTDP-4-dehydrorhamnose reductase
MSCFKNLVIRTSFIGSSPKSSISSGLVFRLQALKKDMIFEIVEDYRWNGVTTDVLCEMVLGIIKNETHARGLIHLGCKNGLQRHSLIKNILTILNKENIEVSTAVGRQPRNLTLDTRKIETVSILWSYSSFPQVPSVNELLSKMKIYNHK